MITDPETVRRLIREHGRWFHEIELAPGIVTPGDDSNRLKLPILDRLGLPADARGLRVLDVGCSDGYFAFEMERRGAEVVAVDFVPEEATGFAVARRVLGSRVEYRMDSVYNLSPERYGRFDVALCLGVLYHLRQPLPALDALRSVTAESGKLFLATLLIDRFVVLSDGSTTTLDELDPRLAEIPLWQFYPGDSLNGDATNCFAPNRAALVASLAEAEFRVEACEIHDMGGYVRAIAVEDPEAARYRDLDGRLETTPFDPDVPYFLDEDPKKLTITGRRRGGEPDPES